MLIYVASSWRNDLQPNVVSFLRRLGHRVYDFKNPPDKAGGFHWSEIDPMWTHWSNDKYVQNLQHTYAQNGFARDMGALMACDACVLVMPCGRSAHLELGWSIGARKATAILLEPDKPAEPELMYLMADYIGESMGDMLKSLTNGRRGLVDLYA